jgi:hypothetical protein
LRKVHANKVPASAQLPRLLSKTAATLRAFIGEMEPLEALKRNSANMAETARKVR